MVSTSTIVLLASFSLLLVSSVLGTFPTQSIPAHLLQAFKLDHFHPVSVSYRYNHQTNHENTAFAVRAASDNVTLLSDHSHKQIFYVQASNWFDMGYCLAKEMHNETMHILQTYEDHIIADLVDHDFDKKHRGEPWYELLLKLLTNLFREESLKHFDWQYFPSEFREELRGWLKGMHDMGHDHVKERDFVTVLFGFDFLLAQVYGNLIGDALSRELDKFIAMHRHGQRFVSISERAIHPLDMQNMHEYQRQILTLLKSTDKSVPQFIKPPVFCDSFSTMRNFNHDPSNTYFARDFQFNVAELYQKYQTMVIYNPLSNSSSKAWKSTSADSNTDHAFISVQIPGMVGSITTMNDQGVAIGIDVLRSGLSNPKLIGLSGIGLVKHVAMHASSTQHAVDLATQATRGCSWIFPITDRSGDAVVLEAGATCDKEKDPLDLLEFWQYRLSHLLPSKHFLEQNSHPEWHRGIYVRRSNYSQPGEFFQFNKKLFEYANVEYHEDGFKPNAFLFKTWQEEWNTQKRLENDYFSPQRISDADVIIAANHALIPQSRIAQMVPGANFLSRSQKYSQFRYDLLWKELREHKGQIDFEKAWKAITVLSPDRTPGIWNERLYPDDPMSAIVEGTISLCDLKNLRMRSLGGYWKDQPLEIHLGRYLNQ